MAMTQGGRAKDGGVGFVHSIKTDGSDQTYVRVIQWMEDGVEVRRSTYNEDATLKFTHHYAWVDGVAQVAATETEGPTSDEEMATLRQQGYQF